MRIVIDRDFDVHGNLMAEHVVHTEVAAWNVWKHPDHVSPDIDPLTALKAMQNNAAHQVSNGWTRITNRPDYPGKTLWQVFLAEIIAHNDVPTRTALGV